MTGEASDTSSDAVNGLRVARRIPLRGIQRIVANRTLAGTQQTAHVTAMAEVDATALMAATRTARERITGLTLTHVLLKATAVCLRAHPRLNATIDDQSICEYTEVNVVVALSLPSDDLLGVVIKNADERPMSEMVAELQALQQRAEAGNLSLEEVQGGTFTLSNYGMLRTVVWATPILTPGQAGILGVGRATPRLVPNETSEQGWAIRPVLPISLTYDHRIVNGVPAGRFIDELAGMLQQPAKLLE